ncbi:MAG TPA: S-adenosylmethionine:tRNA ribosyltransferase-isomerase [Myxococcales bacterium]|nr:S-adenosylmethionine:tRNA ribosyltransferase-isomerase [Myxococcales bacterium]
MTVPQSTLEVPVARWPRADPLEERLLAIDPRSGRLQDLHVRDLTALLAPRDLLVVNDAATLPASLRGRTGAGAEVELRLLEAPVDGVARAVLFGAGDWRMPTEHRPAPPRVRPGDRVAVAPDGPDPVMVTVEAVDPERPRLLSVRFAPTAEPLWAALYRCARAVQYSYVAAPLELWHVQTAYAARPWAVEPPSAGRPLRWSLLEALRNKGVGLATLTHGAGLSNTGDPAIDAALPLPERYEVPAATVEAVAATKANGGRVLAVGTTVVRALEGAAAAHGGELVAGAGVTGLKLGPGFRRRVVDGILTGMHEPSSSHFQLLLAFAPDALLRRAHAHALGQGYLWHEFGDSCLVLPSHIHVL